MYASFPSDVDPVGARMNAIVGGGVAARVEKRMMRWRVGGRFGGVREVEVRIRKS